MNKILILLFLMSFNKVAANNFFELINDSTIKFYLDERDELTDKSNAKYYKICNLPNCNKNPEGKFDDYFLTENKKVFSGFYHNGKLHDSVNYYYKNGVIKECGKYNDGLKTDEWKFFYQNGNLKKVLVFNNNKILIKELYKKNGKHIIDKGTGAFKEDIISLYDLSNSSQINGEVRNGEMDGKWELLYSRYDNQGCERRLTLYINERYDSGAFKTGTNDLTFEEKCSYSKDKYITTNKKKSTLHH